MSKRPNIRSGAEQKTERRIQAERKARDRQNAKKRKKAVKKVPEPEIVSYSRGPVEGEVPAKVRAWIRREAADQRKHYRRIYREIDEIAPLRRKWAKEFLARISGPRGFSVHAGTRRTIKKSELPKQPRRPWRVVW